MQSANILINVSMFTWIQDWIQLANDNCNFKSQKKEKSERRETCLLAPQSHFFFQSSIENFLQTFTNFPLVILKNSSKEKEFQSKQNSPIFHQINFCEKIRENERRLDVA